MSISSVSVSYGYTIPMERRVRSQDGIYTSQQITPAYLPKPYCQIQEERVGDYSYAEDLKRRTEEAAKIPTSEYLTLRSTANASNQPNNQTHTQTTPLTEDDIARLSEKYYPGMPMAEFDEVLVELIDIGAITEQDRMLALGMRKVPNVMFNSGMVMVNYEERVNFSDIHNQDDLFQWLERIDELLVKQSVELMRMGHDYSELSDERNSCQRLMEILAAIENKKG